MPHRSQSRIATAPQLAVGAEERASVVTPQVHIRGRVFCLPHAGGTAAVFHPWADGGDPGLEVCAFQPPGRGERSREAPYTSIWEIAAEATASFIGLTDVPYVIYGNGVGALGAYETARELVRRGAPPPERLFLAAHRGPGIAPLVPSIHGLYDAAFVEALLSFYGAPQSLLAKPKLMAAFLPLLRADYLAMETYQHAEGRAPLPCPITVLAGEHDPTAPPWSMDSWRECTMSTLTAAQFEGGHVFWQHRHEEVFALVRNALDESLAMSDSAVRLRN